jgi:hypothetical protein
MKPRLITLIPSLLVGLLLGGLTSCTTKSVESLVGGEEVHALISDLEKATTCEVYRIDDSYPGENKPKKGKVLHGFSVLSEAKPMKDDSRKALSKILSNPKTYIEHSVPIDCSFRPGIAFRFADGKIEVDLLVCFSCRELRYYLDGKLAGWGYFESQQILELTKQLFPNDKKIQSLK